MKRVVVACSEAPSKHLRRGTEENHELFSENNLPSCRDPEQAIL